MEIINISADNIRKASETLFLAFRSDPLMLWLFDGARNYEQKGLKTIKTWVNWTVLFGVAIATPNLESVALYKKPKKHQFNLWGLFRSGMMRATQSSGKETSRRILLIDQILQNERDKNMPDDNFWYCWLLGTHPQYRRQGLSQQLMQYIFNRANQQQVPCYLETVTEENLLIYQKQGFELKSTISVPQSPLTFYCMVKPPDF